MVDHTFLFAPEYQVLKKILRDEILGKLFHFYSIRADFGKFPKMELLSGTIFDSTPVLQGKEGP